MISKEQNDLLQSLEIEFSSLTKRQQEHIIEIFSQAQCRKNKTMECLNILKESQLSVSQFADVLSIDRTTLYTKNNKPILSVINALLTEQKKMNPYAEINALKEKIENYEQIIDNLRERDVIFINCQEKIKELESKNEGLLQKLSAMENMQKKKNNKPTIYALPKASNNKKPKNDEDNRKC